MLLTLAETSQQTTQMGWPAAVALCGFAFAIAWAYGDPLIVINRKDDE